MQTPELTCRTQLRRRRLFGNAHWNGIDYVEVADDQRSLCVHFFGSVPEGLTAANVRIEGGRRIRDVRAEEVTIDRAKDAELDDCLHIRVNKPGDFSIYRLCLVERAGDRPLAGMDPRYACLEFTFKVNCPSDLDCRAGCDCPPEKGVEPQINYLAKDYASFRQLILDRLAFTLPGWQERHAPDIGITLVEILAYAADHLSYYQDAVATEAYLDTARLRISVRRHARLVDYRMHEGCNARAWVTVEVSADTPPYSAADFYFVTGFAGIRGLNGRLVREQDLPQSPPGLYEVFEPRLASADEQVRFRAAYNEIRFYTWGDTECCLPKGAVRATLLDAKSLQLSRGDVLIFEEVLGPTTGNPADADPARRHAVRLTNVTHSVDGLLGNQPVLEIEWGAEDALPFSLCLSTRLGAPDCRRIENVSVARGNVVLVDHGRTVREPVGPVEETSRVGECACDGSVIEETRRPRPLRPKLAGAPVTFAEPMPKKASAARLLQQDARQALPDLELRRFLPADVDTATGEQWIARYDLLASGPDDRHFVAEIDDDGRAHLRFGDGELGLEPAAGLRFQARYRVGNGTAGNVGRETITHMVLRNQSLSGVIVQPRNPLPAAGGTEPEPTAEVKLFAPHAFRNRLERAITPEDYSALAARDQTRLQRAATQLRWTGSWYEARVAIDPAASETADAALRAAIKRGLFKYRRMGHDLAVVPARYVPLKLNLEVCVLAHHARAQVRAELLRVFGTTHLPDGTLGFFNPDGLSFGDGIYLSAIVARAKAIAGVETVKVSWLARAGATNAEAAAVLESGVLPLNVMEIAQLDNDPSFPESGTLSLVVRGGR